MTGAINPAARCRAAVIASGESCAAWPVLGEQGRTRTSLVLRHPRKRRRTLPAAFALPTPRWLRALPRSMFTVRILDSPPCTSGTAR
jgi:hypothetical protein